MGEGNRLDGPGSCTVAIVAGSRLYRDGLAGMLTAEPSVDVVATAPDTEAGVDEVLRANADVVLFELGNAGSAQAVRSLVEAAPSTRVVALTVPETEQAIIDCAEAGVAGFVTREGTLDDVVASIESAARGETFCSPRMAAIFLERIRTLARARPEPDAGRRLTSRESEIVELIDQGLSNKEIASRLFIEVATVKNHVHNILDKLQVRRRIEAAAFVRSQRRSGSELALRN